EQLARRLVIHRDAIALKIFRVGRAGVVLETEPFQIGQNLLQRFAGRALAIGVVDSEDERAAMVPREEIREQTRADVAYVQRAGRTRGKPGAYDHAVTPIGSFPF